MRIRRPFALLAFFLIWLACSSPVITEKAPMEEVKAEIDKLVLDNLESIVLNLLESLV